MQSVTGEIRLAIKNLLDDLESPVYNNYVPPTENGNAYVLISDVITNDASPKDKPATETLLTIGVYTRESLANDDSICDAITAGIYQRLFNSNSAKLSLSNSFNNFDIKFVSERPETLSNNNFVYVNRFLTFRLSIYQR